jgi:serine/threonine protein kinase
MSSPPARSKEGAGSSLPAAPTPFGSYLLLGQVGRGGMAEVYRARKPNHDDVVAIKCMRPNLARDSRFVDMFLREGKLAMLLEHDSIVRTYEVGRIDGHYFIAMEFLAGKDLAQLLRACRDAGQRIPVPHALHIAVAILRGLDYAHARTDAEGRPLHIVNRDVSPSNVRLTYDGEVKLLDFGIAQAMLKLTSEIGHIKGKFPYMSPEQIRGMRLDARSDIFSAGILLHEMLTIERLFQADTEFALMERVRRAEVPAPSQYNRRVPAALDRVVLRALARDVDDRFQTAAECADELAQILGGYDFAPAELADFVRKLFKADYDAEQSALRSVECGEATSAVPLPVESPTPSSGARTPSLWSRLRGRISGG